MAKVQAVDRIRHLFTEWKGAAAERITPVAASGSPRKYFRLFSEGESYIGAYNPDLKENHAFTTLAKHFRSKELPVPEVLAENRESGCYLLSDHGETVLFDMLAGRNETDVIAEDLYERLSETIRMLPHFQVKGAEGLDWSVCYPRPSFDMQSMMWDLNYFKYYILKTAGITFSEQLLENDFRHFAEFLLQAGQEYFMYRDFQSRNVLWFEDRPWFIDFQGGRKGPLQYDLASFLYQVKAHIPEHIREKLMNEYLDELGKIIPPAPELFMKYYYPFVYLRLFQVMGAYGFRGLFEKRPHFADSLEPALLSLAELLHKHPLEPELTELKSVLRKLVQESKYLPVHRKASKLRVTVQSFSYKKGLPEDPGGNGGGFIFDCRALPNPGREEEYRELNGRDPEVIDYLKKHREVDTFLYNIYELCDPAVENYIEREFEHLCISFGCTGGQHRSVYCADKLAEHLAGKYVISVGVHHREQNISETRQ